MPARASRSAPQSCPRMNNPQQNDFLENVALYGGSFDPVHLGHLAVARAAAERFELARVYFVPADVQPLKSRWPDRYRYDR